MMSVHRARPQGGKPHVECVPAQFDAKMLLRRVPNFFCGNLHIMPPLPDFQCFIHLALLPVFSFALHTSQACNLPAFKRKFQLFVSNLCSDIHWSDANCLFTVV